jgi:predicted nucleic acid-binding protein
MNSRDSPILILRRRYPAGKAKSILMGKRGELILADSSVLIDILATKNAPEILRSLRDGVSICTAVEAESLFLRNEEPDGPPEAIALEPLFSEGVLQRTVLESEIEASLYVNLAADLDDGEAMTLAITHQRGLIAATDDRKARRIAMERLRGIALIRTTNVLHMWEEYTQPKPVTIGTLLRRIRDVARFQPSNDDPLRDWWMTRL